MVPKKHLLARPCGLFGWSSSLFTATGLLLAALSSCVNDKTDALLGTWQAERLIEEGDTVDINLENVSLEFTPQKNYFYTSTLDYVEPGTFELRGDVLYTEPAENSGQRPRKVQVLLLDSARLHILMVEAGKQRKLEFTRVEVDREPLQGFGESLMAMDSLGMDTSYYEAEGEDLELMHDHDHDHDH